jgi:L-fuculose-phosphate aldolase
MNMKRNIKEDIVAIGKRLYEASLNGSYGGNFSVRDEDYIYITPAGLPKDILEYTDILVIDFKGAVLEGEGKPSTEVLFHIMTYKKREGIKAIIHAHPPFATGFSIAGIDIGNNINEESSIILGKIPVLPYEVTSSISLAEEVSENLQKCNAVLLSNHGAITVAENLEKAFRRMEELENLCKMIFVAKIMGGVKTIPPDKLKKLFDLQKQRENSAK